MRLCTKYVKWGNRKERETERLLTYGRYPSLANRVQIETRSALLAFFGMFSLFWRCCFCNGRDLFFLSKRENLNPSLSPSSV